MRYTNESVESIWSERCVFVARIKTELKWLTALSDVRMADDRVPSLNDLCVESLLETSRELEKKHGHDIASMVIALERELRRVGYKSYNMVHFGLTSSDVVDTTLSTLYRDSFDFISHRLRKLISSSIEDNIIVPARTHGADTGIRISLWTRFGRIMDELVEEKKAIDSLKFYGKMSGPVGLADGFNDHKTCEVAALSRLGLEAHPGSTQVIPRQVYAEYHFRMAVVGKVLSRLANCIRLSLIAGEISFKKNDSEIGSSSMPHKVNPWRLERVIGMSRMLDSHVMVALDNIDLWLERDISHSCSERSNPRDGFNLLARMITDLKDELVRICGVESKLEGFEGSRSSYHDLNRMILHSGKSREECHSIIEGTSYP